jgi:hypothetical protein
MVNQIVIIHIIIQGGMNVSLFDWIKGNKIGEVTYCINCGIETGSKVLCNACNKVAEFEYEFHCDGCGEPFPKSHLVYVEMWDGHFCNSCQE